MPTKLWSISGWRNGCRGCTSRNLVSSRLKAGLGTGLCGAVAVAACADRFAVSDTFRFDVDCAWVGLRYGDTAAGVGVEEKRRARGRHWIAFLAVLVCSIVAAVTIDVSKR